MIKKIKCIKGHYYDSKYSKCPFCEDENRKKNPNAMGIREMAKGLFDKQKKGKKKPGVIDSNFDSGRTVHLGEKYDASGENQSSGNSDSPSEGKNVTFDFDNAKTQYTGDGGMLNFDEENARHSNEEPIIDFDGGFTQHLAVSDVAEETNTPADDDIPSDSELKGIDYSIPSNAVIGWLVVMKGIQIGNDIRLNRGINYIYKDDRGIYDVQYTKTSQGLFSISYDELKNNYVIEAFSDKVKMNGKKFEGCRSIFNNSIINIGEDIFELIQYCRGINRWKR